MVTIKTEFPVKFTFLQIEVTLLLFKQLCTVLTQIHMQDAHNGWCGGVEGQLYQTTNGGADWIVNGSIGSSLLDIDFPPNSDSGYCCGYTVRFIR
jgi:hypothetical protein